jgi:hypothetical protein
MDIVVRLSAQLEHVSSVGIKGWTKMNMRPDELR